MATMGAEIDGLIGPDTVVVVFATEDSGGFCVQLREINLYKEGDTTHYKTVLTQCNLRRCWDDVKTQSKFVQRRKEVDVFNRSELYFAFVVCVCVHVSMLACACWCMHAPLFPCMHACLFVCIFFFSQDLTQYQWLMLEQIRTYTVFFPKIVKLINA